MMPLAFLLAFLLACAAEEPLEDTAAGLGTLAEALPEEEAPQPAEVVQRSAPAAVEILPSEAAQEDLSEDLARALAEELSGQALEPDEAALAEAIAEALAEPLAEGVEVLVQERIASEGPFGGEGLLGLAAPALVDFLKVGVGLLANFLLYLFVGNLRRLTALLKGKESREEEERSTLREELREADARVAALRDLKDRAEGNAAALQEALREKERLLQDTGARLAALRRGDPVVLPEAPAGRGEDYYQRGISRLTRKGGSSEEPPR